MPWDRELAGENVIGLKARRNGHHFLQAQAEQGGAGEENEC